MYISSDIADRIKQLAKSKGITIKQLLLDCGLGFNTMSHLKTSFPKSDTLAKIADYLNVSTDYLLGRNSQTQDNINDVIYFSSGSFSNEEKEEILKFIEFIKNKRDK